MTAAQTIEIRVPNGADLDRAVLAGTEVVSLGQEGCFTKAPTRSDIDDLVRLTSEAGLRSGLVVPIAWPRTEQAVHELAQYALSAGVDTVTVNDWGTAFAVSEPGRVVLGLGLTRARSMEPSGETRRTSLDGSLCGAAARLGMAGLEVDQVTDVPAEDQPTVRTVLGPEIVSWSRSCPTLRARGAPGQTPSTECTSLCDTPIRLRASSRWRLIDGKREALPAGVTPPEVTVWGNAVYRDPGADISRTSHVVVDTRHLGWDMAIATTQNRPSVTHPQEEPSG